MVNNNRLHIVQSSDYSKAMDVLFESFRSDPFFKYLLESASIDSQITKLFQKFILTIGATYGEVYAPSNKIEGVSVWLPPRNAHITGWMSLRCGVLRLRRSLPGNLKHSVWKRMLLFSQYSDVLFKKYLLLPHWYLLAIGVADAYRGKGYASSMMNPILEKIDRDGLPCYLETHNERNVSLYQHFGFEILEVSKLPESDQTQWSMLRKPKA